MKHAFAYQRTILLFLMHLFRYFSTWVNVIKILKSGFIIVNQIRFLNFYMIQLTTHLWIQGYLRKAFCWFSREVFELEMIPIPIFASSFQGLSDEQVKFSLRPTQQLTLDNTWFWAIYLTDNKTFLPFGNSKKIFDKICSFGYLLWTIKRHFKIR